MDPFRIHILGCGSALPTARHNASSQVVELRDKMFMVDCAEGTQTQLRRSRIHFMRIGHVFISHLHGDHCFGLIGMISTFGLLGRKAPLHIFAPAALRPVLDQQLAVFCRDLDFQVVFHAVDTRRVETVYEDRSLTVTTLPLDHRVPCCGYLFREKAGRRHIRRDMIDCYEVPLSQIELIRAGADYHSPDGRVVANGLLTTPPDPPRSYAYCSDTRYMPALAGLVSGVSVLYHESTYLSADAAQAGRYCHSTARDAATVARDAGVGQLLLGHFSARYDDEELLRSEALEVFPRVALAQEGRVVEIK